MQKQKNLERIINKTIQMLKHSKASAYEVSLSQSTAIVAKVHLDKVESLQRHLDIELGVRVYLGKRSGYASGYASSDASLENLIASALDIAKYTEPDPFSGLAPSHRLVRNVAQLNLYDENMASIETMIETLRCSEANALVAREIHNSDGAELNSLQAQTYYANSKQLLVWQNYSQHQLALSVIAKRGNELQSAYDYDNSIAFKDLADAASVGKKAAQYAREKLGARSMQSQNLPIIFSAKVAASLFTHVLAALSGGNQYRKTTFLLNSLDKRVMPAWLCLEERPLQKALLGSQAYDADGVAKQSQYFIKDGRVQRYVMGQYSANQLGLETTACAGGVSNCYINANTDKSCADLIKQMQRGIVVDELMGQGVNLTTGNYSRAASGFYVDNGQIQYALSGITIAGNLKEMLAAITYIGSDVDNRHTIKVGSVLIDNMTISGK